MPHRTSRPAFSLVELLVVLGILAILIGLLRPALSRARANADRIGCRGHLHDLGVAFQMYLNESKQRLPRVNTMPSLRPLLNDFPAVTELLAPYLGNTRGVFACRRDRITQRADGAAGDFDTYCGREGSSFQYSPELSSLSGGKPLSKARGFARRGASRLEVMYDYEPFHGAPGTGGSRSYLFADGHVGDREEETEVRDVLIR